MDGPDGFKLVDGVWVKNHGPGPTAYWGEVRDERAQRLLDEYQWPPDVTSFLKECIGAELSRREREKLGVLYNSVYDDSPYGRPRKEVTMAAEHHYEPGFHNHEHSHAMGDGTHAVHSHGHDHDYDGEADHDGHRGDHTPHQRHDLARAAHPQGAKVALPAARLAGMDRIQNAARSTR